MKRCPLSKSIVFALALTVMSLHNVKAQYVTIPDPEFVIWLQDNGFASCLNGSQLDTTCSLVTTAEQLEIYGGTITTIDGIQYFNNLLTLSCYGNLLTDIPPLPLTLEELYVGGNNLSSLPPLPPSLVKLYCNGNNLTSLPPLPDSLEVLYCDDNSLTSLPALPPSLATLTCAENQLTAIPALPASLITLDCEYNQISSFPTLPLGMTSLNCDFNALSELPVLPDSLTNLKCGYNNLTALPALPSKLTYLHCWYNQIVDIPALPNTLGSLRAHGNPVGELPALPASLQTLGCSDCSLSQLPNLPPNLKQLGVTNNQITVLPALPQSLYAVLVSGNPIYVIPDLSAHPNNLSLNCNECPNLTELPALPDTIQALVCFNSPNIMCLPPFKRYNETMQIWGTGITCLPNYITHPAGVPYPSLPICDLYNTNGCPIGWNISGNVYADSNVDCMQTPNEPGLYNVKLNLFRNGILEQQLFTTEPNTYTFDTNVDTFVVSVDTSSLPFDVICPTNNEHVSVLSPSDSLDYEVNFGLECEAGHDVGVQSVVAQGSFRPAMTTHLYIAAGDIAQYFGMACNTAGVTGTLQLAFSGPVAYAGNVNGPQPTNVTGNLVTWDVSDWSSWNPITDYIGIALTTDTFAVFGSWVCITTVAMSGSGDNNPTNDTVVQCFEVVNSYDPNIKEVFPTSVINPGDWHTYTVHFQNTGTAAAQHILVKDTLDPNLDWSSFQLLAYSHDNLTQVLNNGIVHFNFPNINLPDSTSNEPDSHGWIQYRIKTDSTITPGTIIHNTAAIYFDFNDPIITNDALVTYCTPVETQQTFTICQGDSVQVNNQWLHQSGIYTNLYIASTGCDSTVTTTLVVNPTVAFVENYTLCPGDSVTVNGEVFHQAVSFIDTTIGTNGCDVLLITNIIESSVDASIALVNDTLVAAAGMESYQWIDCDLGQPVAGATMQTFLPTQNGHYAVMVTANDACTVVSECLEVIIDGIQNIDVIALTVTPNPASQLVNIRCNRVLHQGDLFITDITGRTMIKTGANGMETQVDLRDLGDGTYFVQIREHNKAIATQKLVVMNR